MGIIKHARLSYITQNILKSEYAVFCAVQSCAPLTCVFVKRLENEERPQQCPSAVQR